MERGKKPAEVNADVAAFSFKQEADKRKHFIGEAFQLMQYLIACDVEAYESYKAHETDAIDLYTQTGLVHAFNRDGGFKRAISLMVTPGGVEPGAPGNETCQKLRILFPISDSFAYTEEDFEALEDPTEIYTEWTRIENGELRVNRWVISEESMFRYVAITEADNQKSELDDSSALEKMQGRQLIEKLDPLSKIINDFVYFKKAPQRHVVRQNVPQ